MIARLSLQRMRGWEHNWKTSSCENTRKSEWLWQPLWWRASVVSMRMGSDAWRARVLRDETSDLRPTRNPEGRSVSRNRRRRVVFMWRGMFEQPASPLHPSSRQRRRALRTNLADSLIGQQLFSVMLRVALNDLYQHNWIQKGWFHAPVVTPSSL